MLFTDLSSIRVFLKPGYTDMRNSINGLSSMTKILMRENPLSGHFFIFCNRRRNRLKILYWDKNGFCLWLKRLEKHKFPWPVLSSDKEEIDVTKLKLLLEGINIFNVHEELEYSSVC